MDEPTSVDALIAVLTALSPEDRKRVVVLEGCDCVEEWGGTIDATGDDSGIYLLRKAGE